VPVVHEVIRVPHETSDDSDGGSKRKRAKTTKPKPAGPERIKFVDPKTKEEMEKRTTKIGQLFHLRVGLIASSGSVKLHQIQNESCRKGEAVADPTSSLASGFFCFPKGSEKFVRESGDMSIMCYVISGTLQVTVHETSFTVERGSCFCIPKGNVNEFLANEIFSLGNQYQFENVGSGEGKIFYVNERSSKSQRRKESEASSSITASGSSL
jgi:quercetin dioxygenase-like cupin family protein